VTQGRRRFRLNMGMGRLETWAATAGQIDKNAVYKALFAVSDGTVFQNYKVLDDVHQAREFFIMVRPDLVVKVCFHETDAFGILYIGPIEEAPDIDLGLGKSA
jgi:Family of unknown function (DUF6235)